MSDHKCFDVMNEDLKPYNAKIATAISISDDDNNLHVKHLVQTQKLDNSVRSKKVPLVVMTYCPFCGINLSDAEQSSGKTV